MRHHNLDNPMTNRRLFLMAVPVALAACTSLQTQNVQSEGLKGYRRAYVEPVPEDEFRVVPALIAELASMGFEVTGRPFVEPTDADLIVRAAPVGGWDMTRYLQSLQLTFMAAKSGRIVTSSSFYSKGAWLGVRDARLKAVFNDFREKNGFPPSTQFP